MAAKKRKPAIEGKDYGQLSGRGMPSGGKAQSASMTRATKAVRSMYPRGSKSSAREMGDVVSESHAWKMPKIDKAIKHVAKTNKKK